MKLKKFLSTILTVLSLIPNVATNQNVKAVSTEHNVLLISSKLEDQKSAGIFTTSRRLYDGFKLLDRLKKPSIPKNTDQPLYSYKMCKHKYSKDSEQYSPTIYYPFSCTPEWLDHTIEYLKNQTLEFNCVCILLDASATTDYNTQVINDLMERLNSINYQGRIIIVGNKGDQVPHDDPSIFIKVAYENSNARKDLRVVPNFLVISAKEKQGITELKELIVDCLTNNIPVNENIEHNVINSAHLQTTNKKNFNSVRAGVAIVGALAVLTGGGIAIKKYAEKASSKQAIANT